MKKIIIDIYGSDLGPLSVIKGAQLILDHYDDIGLVLVGDKELINKNIDNERIEIIDTKEYIDNLDDIFNAFFKKQNASLVLASKRLKEDDNCIGMISPGNSGALLIGGLVNLLKEGVNRPCIAAILPAENGGYVCLVDCGANTDCNAIQLHEFAKFGQELMRNLYKIDNPRIGLLSIGKEDSKGNRLVKDTFVLLSEDKSLNFVGNFEGNDALSGECDVLVCDGFNGNQILKVTEGTARRIIHDIAKYSKENNIDNSELLNHLANVYDFSTLGGGIILGIKKPIIKCRGNSNETTYLNTASMLINMLNNKSLYDRKK